VNFWSVLPKLVEIYAHKKPLYTRTKCPLLEIYFAMLYHLQRKVKITEWVYIMSH